MFPALPEKFQLSVFSLYQGLCFTVVCPLMMKLPFMCFKRFPSRLRERRWIQKENPRKCEGSLPRVRAVLGGQRWLGRCTARGAVVQTQLWCGEGGAGSVWRCAGGSFSRPHVQPRARGAAPLAATCCVAPLRQVPPRDGGAAPHAPIGARRRQVDGPGGGAAPRTPRGACGQWRAGAAAGAGPRGGGGGARGAPEAAAAAGAAPGPAGGTGRAAAMEEPLCCCEYVDRRGRRSHLAACCCDCEELDDGCDRYRLRDPRGPPTAGHPPGGGVSAGLPPWGRGSRAPLPGKLVGREGKGRRWERDGGRGRERGCPGASRRCAPRARRWLTCKSLPPGALERIADTIADRLRVPWFSGAVKINVSLVPPLVLLPVFLHVAALHFLLGLIILTSLPVVVLWYYYLTHRRKERTLFFLSLGLFSLGYMYYVFLREVVPRGHVEHSQVVTLTCGLILMLAALSRAKKDPGYLPIPAGNEKPSHQGLHNKSIRGSFSGLHGISGAASSRAVNGEAKGYCRMSAEQPAGVKKDWCTKCQLVRPARAGHCRLCGRCVRRLDHHCVW